MYNFSLPLPFNTDFIDKLELLNQKYSKSKITSLYNGLPCNASDLSGFEQSRSTCDDVKSFEDLSKYILYAQDKGFKFVYLLNSPHSFDANDENLNLKLKNLSVLLEKLYETGCDSVRITNTQLIAYVNKNFPEFKIHCSTSQEYTQLKQYQNLFFLFNNIKEVIPSWDLNKNFKFLTNFKKQFPNIVIELMINEGCVAGCPLRTHHNLFLSNKYSEKNKEYFSFFVDSCNKIAENNFWEFVCKSNIIYPWDIEEYGKIGVTNFKFVGRNMKAFYSGAYINIYDAYFAGVEDKNNIADVPFRIFNNYFCQHPDIHYTVGQIRPYLPNIKHFVKKGVHCSSTCGSECGYCYECAKKLNKKYPVQVAF